MKKIIIIGSGETAELAYDYFTRDSSYEVAGFAIENPGENEKIFCDKPVFNLKDIPDRFPCDKYTLFVAIGSKKLNTVREHFFKLYKSIGYDFATYVSSHAIVNPNVKVGENCFILEGNNLQYGVTIEDNCFLWSFNHIGHRTVIKENTFISSGVVISGFCTIGKNSFVGVNACVADEVAIGDYNFISLGAVVNKSTETDELIKAEVSQASSISASKLTRAKISLD